MPIVLAPIVSTTGGKRTEEQKAALAKQVFTKGSIEFAGHHSLVTLPSTATAEQRKAEIDEYLTLAPCKLCGGTHKVKRANLTTFWKIVKTGDLFAISDTCRVKYVEPLLKDALTNFPLYRKYFPL